MNIYLINEPRDGMGETYAARHDNVTAANRRAWIGWQSMTPQEKKRRHIYVCAAEPYTDENGVLKTPPSGERLKTSPGALMGMLILSLLGLSSRGSAMSSSRPTSPELSEAHRFEIWSPAPYSGALENVYQRENATAVDLLAALSLGDREIIKIEWRGTRYVAAGKEAEQ